MPDKISLLARNATLRQLQVFDSIARHKSFSRAAEELNLTQPTVSVQVKKLSEILKAPLFEPDGRRVKLTPSGRALYEAVQVILTQLSRVEQKINYHKGLSGGTVSLSVISTAQYFVPQVIQKFTQMYPDVTVVMRVGNHENLMQRMQENKDDFYLLGQSGKSAEELEVSLQELSINPIAFIAHPSHPLVDIDLELSQLKDEPFLMRESGSGIRHQVESVFKEHQFEPKTKMVLGGNEAIRLGVMQNLGIAAASIPTVLSEIEEGKIALLNVKGFPLMRHWYLSHPKDRTLSLAAEKLIQLIHGQAKKTSQEAFALIESS